MEDQLNRYDDWMNEAEDMAEEWWLAIERDLQWCADQQAKEITT